MKHILALAALLASLAAADCNTCTLIPGSANAQSCTALACFDSSWAVGLNYGYPPEFRIHATDDSGLGTKAFIVVRRGGDPDTSTWVVFLEDGQKKLDVHYGNKVYRFRPRNGRIHLSTITEDP